MGTVRKGLLSPLRRLETVTIAIETSAEHLPDALAPVRSELAVMGTYGLGPSFVSEPLSIVPVDGAPVWLLTVDPKGLSAAEAAEIPQMLIDACDKASITDVVVSRAKATERFDVTVPQALMVRIHSQPGSHEVRQRFNEEMAPVLAELVADVTAGAAPALIAGGTLLDVSWSLIRETQGGLLEEEFAYSAIAAHDPATSDGLWSSCNTYQQPDFVLAGTRLADPTFLAKVGDDLRDAMRSLPGNVASTVVTLLPAVAARPIQRLRSFAQFDPYLGDRRRNSDEFLPALGWSTTLMPALWRKVERLVGETDAAVAELGDGRMEVTFGEISSWAPWLGGRQGHDFEAAHAALGPILIDGDDYRARENEKNRQQFAAHQAALDAGESV